MCQFEAKLKEMMKNKPNCLKKEIEEFELIGEKDYRMNMVYVMEHKGAHLVDALRVTDIVVEEIKSQIKKRK